MTNRLIELGADQINLLLSGSEPPAMEDRDDLPPRLTPDQLEAIVDVDGDPLQDISVMSDILYVIKGGGLMVTEGDLTVAE